MTNNETLHAFVDCEKLPNGRNVSEVQWRNNMSYRFISSTPKNHGPIKLRLIADDFFSQPLNQLLCPTSNAALHGAAEAMAGQEPHEMGKPNTWQYSMDLGESENIHGNLRLQDPLVTLKNFAQPCSFSVKFGCCNLGLSCTFLGSPGSIEYCYVFGFAIS